MSDKKGKPLVSPEQDASILQLLVEINNNLLDILKELRDENDEGEYMFVQGTATTNLAQNITDVLGTMGHAVRQLLIKNDDLVNTLEVGYNITSSSIDSNVQTGSARFFPILPGEKFRVPHKEKVIRNVYIRTSVGTAAYRMWLLW